MSTLQVKHFFHILFKSRAAPMQLPQIEAEEQPAQQLDANEQN